MPNNQKIIAYFEYNAPGSGLDKTNRMDVAFVDSTDFQSEIDTSSVFFKGMASTDLSNIFMPFATSGVDYSYPKFYDLSAVPSVSQVRTRNILPFRFNPEGSGFYSLLNLELSGSMPYVESQKGFLAGDQPYPNDTIRHEHSIRGIGTRGPMIVVGWGYDTDGNPFPPGSGVGKFKGEYDYGYEIDPKDYIAAPVDLRYDKTRNVWTGGDSRTKHRHLSDTPSDGGPAFAGFFADNLAEASGLGYLNILPKLVLV